MLLSKDVHDAGPFAWPIYAVALVASALACIGWHAQPSAAVATVALTALLGLPPLGTVVGHAHHLVWFAALLACSPCGDALSVGRPTRGRDPSAYAVPIAAAWILIGCIFFFPGLWKLRTAGLTWGDTLVHHLHWKWLQAGEVPAWRIDQHPQLLRVGGLAVMGFELGAGVLLFARRTRKAAVVGLLALHAVIAATMGVAFSSLWACYLVFVDWDGRTPPAPVRFRWSHAPLAALIAAVVVAGTRGDEHAWPFACYPSFRHPAAPTMPWIRLERNGAEVAFARTPEVHALSFRLRPDQLDAFWAVVGPTSSAAGCGCRIDVFRTEVEVAPEAHQREVGRQFLGALTVP